jgi:hypothetical protein
MDRKGSASGVLGRAASLLLAGLALLTSTIGSAGPVSAGSSPRAATAVTPSPPGSLLWRVRYNGPAGGADEATAVGVSPDGSKVYVTGSSYGAALNADFATIAYNASTGARVWVKRYNGPAGGNDGATAMTVSPDGSRVFVTGPSWGESSGDDYATVAYAASTGAQLWAHRYDGGGLDDPTAIGVTPDGSEVFVTGSSQSAAGDWDYLTVGYTAATGSQFWTRRFDGGYNDNASSLGVSPDGTTVFVTGTQYGGPSNDTMDYTTIAYDTATGAQVWKGRYNGGWDDYASTLAVGPVGSKVYVAGGSYDGTRFNNATVSYDGSTGAQGWVTHNGSTDYHSNSIPMVRVSPDGSEIVVAGSVFDNVNAHDYVTYAYGASTGSLLWTHRYSSPGYSGDLPADLRFSPSGPRVYVTGMSASGPNTFAYKASTGATLWSRRARGKPVALTIAPGGSKVFVAGTYSSGTLDGTDYIVSAYRAP